MKGRINPLWESIRDILLQSEPTRMYLGLTAGAVYAGPFDGRLLRVRPDGQPPRVVGEPRARRRAAHA